MNSPSELPEGASSADTLISVQWCQNPDLGHSALQGDIQHSKVTTVGFEAPDTVSFMLGVGGECIQLQHDHRGSLCPL